jgi:hypothetical protein
MLASSLTIGLAGGTGMRKRVAFSRHQPDPGQFWRDFADVIVLLAISLLVVFVLGLLIYYTR